MRLDRLFLSYGVAIGSTAIALVVTRWLEPFLLQTIGAFFYFAIVVSARYGGFPGGNFAVALSILAIDYFFLPPKHQLAIDSPENVLQLGIFLLVAQGINLLASHLERRKQTETLLHRQLKQQSAVIEISQRIRQSLNLPEILQTIAEEARRFLQCDRVLIFQIEPDNRGTILVQSLDPACNAISSQHTFAPSIDNEQIELFKQGSVIAQTDIETARITPRDREMLASLQVKANLVVPIWQGKNLWGLLIVHQRAAPRHWETSEIELLRQLSAQVSTAVQQANLLQQVQKEALRLQTLFNTSFDGIAILDREGKVLDANPRFAEMLGYTSEEIANLTPFDWDAHFTSEEIEQMMGEWIDVKNRVFQTRHRRKDGSIYDVEISVSVTKWQGEIFRFCICRDITEQKKAEIALQESQLQLQRQLAEIETIYQSAPIGLNVLDTDLRFVRINQRLAEINGFSVAAHIGRTVRELLPDLADAAEQILLPILETGQPLLNVEIVGETPAQPGVQRTWLENFLPLKDGDRVIGISTVCEEITDRKQAQIALQQLNEELEQRVMERTAELTEINERLLVTLIEKERAYQLVKEQAQLLDLAHDSIITWDVNSVITFWNKGAELMYGWTKAEALGQVTHDLLKTQLPKPLAEIQGELFAKGYWEGTIIHFTKDDRPITVSSRWVTQKDDTGKVINILEINNDISDRKRIEKALQESEEKFRQLAENINAVFWMTDIKKRQILYVSDVYEQLWQGKCEDVYRNFYVWLEAIHPEDRPLVEAASIEQQTTGRSDTEYRIVRPDGSLRWIRDRAFAVRDETGTIWRMAGIAEDISDRKQAEQLLELQAVIVRNMAEGICLIRADNGSIVYANPKFEQMFGYDPGELDNQHVSIVNYATESISAEDSYQAIRSAILENTEFSYEVHNIKKDGTPFWCSATCSVFKHPDYGDVLVAVQQDITKRKLAEEALLQKSRKEQLLFSITQALRQSLDLNQILNTAVTEVRQTLQADRTTVYRFHPDFSGDFVVESVGEDWVKLVGGDVQKIWQDTYLQETQGGRFRNKETFIVNDIYKAELQLCHIELLEQFQAKSYAIFPIFAGETLWGLLAVYQNAKPRNWQPWEIELLAEIASQLSIAIQQSELYRQLQNELQERKQAEATIREAERRWRSLLDNVQLIVVGLDRAGNVNYVNPFFLKLTGYTNDEVLGKNWFENFIPPATQQSIQTTFEEVINYHLHSYYRNAIFTKFGEEKFIAWNNTILQDAQGIAIGTISIGEDITEQQKIEKIKEEFIGIVSHELRTPLTAIQMSLGLLNVGIYDKKPEKSRRMIEIALIDTNRLVNLVNDILDLERLESGRAVLEKTVCKAADLLRQAVDGIQAIATQQQISLIVTPTDAEVWAAADAIVQALTNLLSNGIKFSPPNSAIRLSAENQIDYVLFQVSDRGRGIPADKLELIFGKFQQVDASDSREKGGTGLGLAICQSIIERHGGKIWAESVLGEGSTFFFTLPLN
ncbi:MAG TPA: PAS domain S-box protein [Leptolyngbyaceae cyanobacterium]